MIPALLLAVAAARGPMLVPDGAKAALVLESRAALPGLRALFGAAGPLAAGLSPAEVGSQLRHEVGVDLLDEDRLWGLAQGPRALVFGDHAVALSAPVADPRAARRMLATFLYAQDERRPRAGLVSGGRLFTASGKRARELVALLAKGKDPLAAQPSLRPSLARARGPLWLYLRLPEPLRAGVFAVEASAHGLVLRGLLQPSAPGELLTNAAAPACEDGLACLSLAPGPLGRALVDLAVSGLAGRAFAPPARDTAGRALKGLALTAQRLIARVDGLDTRALAGLDESLWALRWSGSGAPATAAKATLQGARPVCIEREGDVVHLSSPCGPAPKLLPVAGPLSAAVDLGGLDAVLAKLSPFDAVRGDVAAFGYAAHLLYGRLLRRAGPLTIRGSPASDLPAAAELELRLPLH